VIAQCTPDIRGVLSVGRSESLEPAERYVAPLKNAHEGVISDARADLAPLKRMVDLRLRYLWSIVGQIDVIGAPNLKSGHLPLLLPSDM
jgi:hypothetical protein